MEGLETRPEAMQAKEKGHIYSYFVQHHPYYCTWFMAAALWNRNYFLRFRFLLLKSYGSGSGSSSDF
jgi:hypothetical protein